MVELLLKQMKICKYMRRYQPKEIFQYVLYITLLASNVFNCISLLCRLVLHEHTGSTYRGQKKYNSIYAIFNIGNDLQKGNPATNVCKSVSEKSESRRL